MTYEDLSSQITGTETAFVTAVTFLPGTLRVHLDGIRQTPDDDYEETAGGFTMALPVPLGSTLLVDYDNDDLISASGT